MSGILWRSRWPEVLKGYGSATTFHNCFVRWCKAAVWHRLLETVSETYVMADPIPVRTHKHAAKGKSDGGSEGDESIRRFCGALKSKVRMCVDAEEVLSQTSSNRRPRLLTVLRHMR